MSYGRIMEDGCYIYPKIDSNGIEVVYFPDEELNFIPDSILDFILFKMSDKELSARKAHGQYIKNLISDIESNDNLANYKNNKDFFKWRDKNVQ